MYLMRKEKWVYWYPTTPFAGLETGNTFLTVYSVIDKVNH